jgi:hypothetical protein
MTARVTLDAKAASSLEKLVRDALELVETQTNTGRRDRLPPDFFVDIAREFGGEPFERPPQGEFEKREGRGNGILARYKRLDFPLKESGRQTPHQGPVVTRLGEIWQPPPSSARFRYAFCAIHVAPV